MGSCLLYTSVLEEICQEHFEVEMTELGEQEAAIIGMTEPSKKNMELLQECVETVSYTHLFRRIFKIKKEVKRLPFNRAEEET